MCFYGIETPLPPPPNLHRGWPGAALIGKLDSKPPLHLEGSGTVSSIWRTSCLPREGSGLLTAGGAPPLALPVLLPVNLARVSSSEEQEGGEASQM